MRIRACRLDCFVSLSFAGLVVLARSLNPIPFRTRPLNSSAPMVLWLKPWESRSLPGLPRTEDFLITILQKTPSPSGGGVFCFRLCFLHCIELQRWRGVHSDRIVPMRYTHQQPWNGCYLSDIIVRQHFHCRADLAAPRSRRMTSCAFLLPHLLPLSVLLRCWRLPRPRLRRPNRRRLRPHNRPRRDSPLRRSLPK